MIFGIDAKFDFKLTLDNFSFVSVRIRMDVSPLLLPKAMETWLQTSLILEEFAD